jgi:hypothetical protein
MTDLPPALAACSRPLDAHPRPSARAGSPSRPVPGTTGPEMRGGRQTWWIARQGLPLHRQACSAGIDKFGARKAGMKGTKDTKMPPTPGAWRGSFRGFRGFVPFVFQCVANLSIETRKNTKATKATKRSPKPGAWPCSFCGYRNWI